MRFIATCCLSLWVIFGHAQMDYPKGYFRNPLNLPMNLSGNFGELRPNHFHMGLDLKTNARQNLPVYAAADGYIARIKTEPAGFGRAIYINHPNGYTTLYAHLNDFSPRLENYVKQEQYSLELWKIEIAIPPGLFPVKKGEFIAYSGNTGGSQAPHLHFEIRETASDINLNPLLFGLPLTDNISPRILRIGVYDRTKSVYEQSPRVFAVKLNSTNYITAIPIIKIPFPKISFAFSAYDTQNGSANLNGIFESQLYMDGQYRCGFRMNEINYNDTRYINAHIDYRFKANGGPFLQQLFELPGYIHSIYDRQAGNGVLDISDSAVHDISILVKDAYGNSSELKTKVRYQLQNIPIEDHESDNAKMYYPLMLDGSEFEDCEFFIGENSLYDSVHIRYNKTVTNIPFAVSAMHTIGNYNIPLHEAFLVRIQPNQTISEEQKNRTVMQWHSGAKLEVKKVEWLHQWASAWFRDFGQYQLIVDEQPPEILPIDFHDGSNLAKATRILFTVQDNLLKVKNIRAELDGKWLRFTNDKGKIFNYRFDEKCLSGEHELKISAEDEAGNETVKKFRFVR